MESVSAESFRQVHFYDWLIDTDIRVTAVYAKPRSGRARQCLCEWCRNWIAGWYRSIPYSVVHAMRRLGINMTSESDVYQHCYMGQGLLYRAVYWCHGRLLSGRDCWSLVRPGSWECNLRELRSEPNFLAVGVSARGKDRLESPGWGTGKRFPLLQVELRATVPWVLDEPMPSMHAT